MCSTVRKTARALTDLYDRILAPSGLLSTQYSVLRKVEARALSITELAEALDLDRTTLGRNLRVMEREHLVKLSTGADQRQRVVSLTPRGKAAFKAAVPLWRRAQDAVNRELSSGERERLYSILSRLDSLDS
jgi:DNA-binding MarR family transcriptional regulator